jgi:uncharacterized membrane protein YfcA
MSLELAQLLSALAVTLVGAAFQSVIGIGFALFAAPLLFLLNPLYLPGPILTLGLVLTLIVTINQRRALTFKRMVPAISGRIPGSFLGIALLAFVPAPLFAIGFGSLLILSVWLSYHHLTVTPNTRNLFIAGLFSGLMGTTTSVGGPPIALVYQNVDRVQTRNDLSLFFLVGTLVSITLLSVYGHYGLRELQLSLELSPAIIVGFLLGKVIETRLETVHIKPVIAAICLVSSVLVITKGLLAL